MIPNVISCSLLSKPFFLNENLKFKLSFKLIIYFTLVFVTTISILLDIGNLLFICNESTILLCGHFMIYNFSLVSHIAIVLFTLKWTKLEEFYSSFDRISFAYHPKLLQNIKNKRRHKNIFIYSLLICDIIISIIYVSSVHEILAPILMLPLPLLIKVGHSSILSVLIDITICMQAAFTLINSEISLFSSRYRSPREKFFKLQKIRKTYSLAVRALKTADPAMNWYTTYTYLECVIYGIMNTVRLFNRSVAFDPTWVFLVLKESLTISYITMNMVNVNKLSREGFEDLYEISFHMNTLELKHENFIFILKMGLTDIGFTLGDIFVINRSFIASLSTLVLTLILGLTNFIKFN